MHTDLKWVILAVWAHLPSWTKEEVTLLVMNTDRLGDCLRAGE